MLHTYSVNILNKELASALLFGRASAAVHANLVKSSVCVGTAVIPCSDCGNGPTHPLTLSLEVHGFMVTLKYLFAHSVCVPIVLGADIAQVSSLQANFNGAVCYFIGQLRMSQSKLAAQMEGEAKVPLLVNASARDSSETFDETEARLSEYFTCKYSILRRRQFFEARQQSMEAVSKFADVAV